MNLVFALADIMKLSVSTLFEFDGELCKLENERWDEMKAIKRKRLTLIYINLIYYLFYITFDKQSGQT